MDETTVNTLLAEMEDLLRKMNMFSTNFTLTQDLDIAIHTLRMNLLANSDGTETVFYRVNCNTCNKVYTQNSGIPKPIGCSKCGSRNILVGFSKNEGHASIKK